MSAAPALKVAAALSMADGCLTSFPAHFTAAAPKPCHHPHFLPLPSRSPIRLLHLATCSSPAYPSLLSLRRRAPLAPFVAQTSDWGQQGGSQVEEEELSLALEEEAEGEEEFESGLSDWDGEDAAVQAVGAAAEAEAEGLLFTEEAAAVDDVEEGEGDAYLEPPEEAKLFVGNLPYDMDGEKLAHLFEEAGIVEVAEVIYNRESDHSRGFGFVTMSTVEEAEKAIEKFHRYDVEGKLLTVNKAAPRGSRPERRQREFEPSFKIYVGNLPWSVDDARLEQAFSEYGKVVDSRVVYDRVTGRSRGFGFVTMSAQQEMDDAIAGLDGHNLDGRTIRVNAADEKPVRRSF